MISPKFGQLIPIALTNRLGLPSYEESDKVIEKIRRECANQNIAFAVNRKETPIYSLFPTGKPYTWGHMIFTDRDADTFNRLYPQAEGIRQRWETEDLDLATKQQMAADFEPWRDFRDTWPARPDEHIPYDQLEERLDQGKLQLRD